MSQPEDVSIRYSRTLVEGVEMHAAVMGVEPDAASPDYVLVHGLGMSGRYLMPTARLLADVGKVHLPDLPGFGESGRPDRVLTVPELADALAGWLEANGITAPILLGNSLGAQVIADFAARYPDRLESAVLVGPTVDPAARRVFAQTWRLIVDIPREPAALYGIGLGDYFRAGFGRVLETLRHALADPVADKLPSIRRPVLIVRGGRDPIVPQAWVEEMARAIPRCRLVVFPEAAHAVNFNSPELLVEEVVKFRREFTDG